VERLFFRQNLQLIAERMNVDMADAAVVQAKLWDNPELSVGDANFWGVEKEKQFSLELSRLFLTAGKRRKLVNREKVSKEMAVRELEETVRSLSMELRKSVNELEYLQTYRKTLEMPQQSLEQLIAAYRKQAAQGNVNRPEVLRLQSSLLELESEMNEVQTALNEQQRLLKPLLNVEPFVDLEIVRDSLEAVSPGELSLAGLLETALEHRPDMQYRQLETKYHERSLIYEQSLRIPNITLSASYDRYGGVWKDFVGAGIRMELPLFNRNQGNIRAAQLSIDKSRCLYRQQKQAVRHEVVEAFDNYNRAYRFYEKIRNDELLSGLDDMPDVYTGNLLNKNISMLEYLDFMGAYKDSKKTVLLSAKNLHNAYAELQYSAMNEIK
jgi:cobalt-zinc-cadmium efflux system outer membrane protein